MLTWDISIMLVLFYSCLELPIRLAFFQGTNIMASIVDLLFFIDMLVIFNSAFRDDEYTYKIIDDRAQIAKRYLKGWFTIDLLAIIPFD